MTRTILIAIVACASACAARSSHPTLPAATRAEVLAHYAQGESLDCIASDFHLDGRDDARDVVHAAISSLTKRYYREH
jgi:hypothetical protein